MLTIEKQYKDVLEHAKNSIQKLEKEQENLYLAWCKALNVQDGSRESQILYDYLFNGYKKHIRFK